MSSLPTIPPSWTAPTSCFATTNYYRVLFGDYFSNMYGTPTPVFSGNQPTGDCFPPSFTIDVPYYTHGDCPQGYTLACATAGPQSNGGPVSTLMCCPSVTDGVFSFMCKDNEYGCHATATEGVVWTGTVTDIGLDDPTQRPITRTPYTDEGIEAWGVKLLSVPTATTTTTTTTDATEETKETLTASSTTASSTTAVKTTAVTTAASQDSAAQPTQGSEDSSDSGNSNDSGSLSTGAIAGIAVGSVAGTALIALALFILYRHRRKRKEQVALQIAQTARETSYKQPYYTYPNPDPGPHQLEATEQVPPHLRLWEMQG